jgi:hypothetical protein
MATNGKSNGHSQAVVNPIPVQDDLLDAGEDKYSKPLDVPEDRIAYSKTGKGYKYYLSLKGKWQVWWDEFATALDSYGKLKYDSIWSFIRSRTKKREEQDFLARMLGPRPYLDEGEKRDVPWLGDWAERRRQGFWAFDNPRKIKDLEIAYKNNVEKLEAARSLGPVIIRHISRFEKLSEQIDEAFAGKPFLPNEAPNSPRNKIRVRHYIRLHKAVLQVSVTLWGQWLRANGLDPNDPTAWMTMRLADGQPILPPGTRSADGQIIEGQLVQGQSLLPGDVTLDDLLMAKAMRAKANKFKMGMPQDLDALVPDTTDEDVDKAKTNGKKVH